MWHLTPCMINYYCANDRIPGAVKVATVWLIPKDAEKLLEVRDLHKSYAKEGVPTKALNGIAFDVLPGEYLGIMGASVSGKTTLLNCIATIIKPTSGQILLSCANISPFGGNELVEYRVNDPGIPASDLPFIFDKGFTEDMGSYLSRSTGMSLFLVRQMADDLAIELKVQSGPGCGTIISLVFPKIRRRTDANTKRNTNQRKSQAYCEAVHWMADYFGRIYLDTRCFYHVQI